MLILAKLLCVLGIGFGIALLIKPVILKQHLSFMSKGKRYYTEGAGKLITGMIFLLAAPQAKVFWFVALIGLIGLVKGILGILLFTFKPEIIESFYKWWLDKPEATYRVFGVVGFVLGLMLLASL